MPVINSTAATRSPRFLRVKSSVETEVEVSGQGVFVPPPRISSGMRVGVGDYLP